MLGSTRFHKLLRARNLIQKRIPENAVAPPSFSIFPVSIIMLSRNDIYSITFLRRVPNFCARLRRAINLRPLNNKQESRWLISRESARKQATQIDLETDASGWRGDQRRSCSPFLKPLESPWHWEHLDTNASRGYGATSCSIIVIT